MSEHEIAAGVNFCIVRSDSPRLPIMISSTSYDLPEHRKQVEEAILRRGHFPLAMEHGSAESGTDAISYSLNLVDQAEVYIGVIGERYGYKPIDEQRNPHELSITELEYQRACKRKIPVFLYLSDAEHPFTRDQYDFDPDSLQKLNSFKDRLQSGHLCGFFKSPIELRALVTQSLSQLQVERITDPRTSTPSATSLPAPPEVYAVPEYILTNKFVGRSTELDLLDRWAKSGNAIMVVEGIGGLGKSALTWEWMHSRSENAIENLAGRIWWSFYERGASLETFVRHALAYITCRDPERLSKEYSHYERGQQLLAELRRKPFLLVLDGFERVLTAYHRLDKAHIPDEKVDLDLRECINPPDGELLMQLLKCNPSKILISTRLFPSGLEDRGSHKPIPGVTHHHLNGLSPEDALSLMRHAGITGEENAILEFADQFGRHSLLLKIVCGMIADYRKSPLNFDAWRADPIYGGGLKLSELDLKQRYTHILHHALIGLDESTRQLLCRIAVLSEGATYDTLAVLNPFLPPAPEEVKPPRDPKHEWNWPALSDQGRTAARKNYETQLEAYRDYQKARKQYVSSEPYRKAVIAFDAALKDLEDRGLLQWDRDTNCYEMHPVVRGHAAEGLGEQDRTETFDKVRDHFSSLPPDNLDEATELTHLKNSLEIYRCLVGAGMWDEAGSLFRKLGVTLFYHVAAYPLVLELLKPLFDEEKPGVPRITSTSDRLYVASSYAIALHHLGRDEEAIPQYAAVLEEDLAHRDWREAARGLRNIAECFFCLDRRAEGRKTLELAYDLAVAARDEEGIAMAIFYRIQDNLRRGDFSQTEEFTKEFLRHGQPQTNAYRNGDLEFCHCLDGFYQGTLDEQQWNKGYAIAVEYRNAIAQCRYLTLRAEWDLEAGRADRALESIDQAIQILNKMGTRRPEFHDLRAWALAKVGRGDDIHAELEDGEKRYYAALAHWETGNTDKARECALNAYRWSWGEGPPHVQAYYLEKSRNLLQQLKEPEPNLPTITAEDIPKIPYEDEIRQSIQTLQPNGPPGQR